MTDFDPQLTQVMADHVRAVPDFPSPGIIFRDITPLLADGEAFGLLVTALAQRYRGRIDAVAGLESRGFIVGAPVAHALGVGMITVRKAGRLPGPVIGVDYSLEYGTARLELREETVADGARVLIVDDVLATGGTARAAVELVERAGGRVEGVAVLLELAGLPGRETLQGYDVASVLTY